MAKKTYMVCDNCGAERKPPQERCDCCGYKLVALDHRSMGAGEFRIICSPAKVKLVIHGGEVVAECSKDVYGELFGYCVSKLGGGRCASKEVLARAG